MKIFFQQWGKFMMMGAKAHARWEIDVSNTILKDRKRMFLLLLLLIPILLGGVVFADLTRTKKSMNTLILNRDFKLPTDGWYQVAPLGEFPRGAGSALELGLYG